MERFQYLVGRLYKTITPSNYFFKVSLVGRFMPLIGGIGRLVEPPLYACTARPAHGVGRCLHSGRSQSAFNFLIGGIIITPITGGGLARPASFPPPNIDPRLRRLARGGGIACHRRCRKRRTHHVAGPYPFSPSQDAALRARRGGKGATW